MNETFHKFDGFNYNIAVLTWNVFESNGKQRHITGL